MSKLIPRWVAGLVGGGIAVVYGVPLLWIALTSLKSPAQIYSGQGLGLFFHPTFAAYAGIASGIGRSLWNSLVISAGSVIMTLCIAIPAAYGLARTRGRTAGIVLFGLVVLQMIPEPATLLPLYRLFAGWGIIGQLEGVILADTALVLPFAVLILRPFFRSVPFALEEAASLDGAGSWGRFWRVALPLARNGVATTGILVFLIAWGEFLYAVTFLSTNNQFPLSVQILEEISFYGTNWSALMALAVVAAGPILLVFGVGYRFLRSGMSVGAVR